MSRISVCIVTYNNSDIVLRAIGSLLKHTVDIQIYISDNNSSYSTVSDIKRAYGHDSRITVVENRKNLGYGKGNNSVLRYITSDYHAIINPDIEIRDNVLERMAEYMDKNVDVALLSPRVLFPDGGEQHLPKRYPSVKALMQRRLPFKNHKSADKYIMLDQDLKKQQILEVATGCFLFTRTHLLKKVEGFDPRYFMYFEDYDLSIRLGKHGKLLYNPEFVVYHDWERAGAKSFKYMVIQIFSMIKFFNRWGWRIT